MLAKHFTAIKEEEKNRLTLDIFGTGYEEYVYHCKNLVRKAGLEGIVQFRGEVKNDNIHKVYRQIDVLIVPSIWPENSPVTIMEALATGTPILASNIGGIPELVENSKSGFLHVPESSHSLAENIQKVLNGKDILSRMQKFCFEKANQHDSYNQVRKIIIETDKALQFTHNLVLEQR